MEMTVEKITPQIAVKYLKMNTDNYRRLSRAQVNRYAEDMKSGRWELNGEAIVFGADGKLKNGQHRLAAIAQAGVTVPMTVIRGIENDVKIYDVGSNRTLNQIASNKEITCDRTIAAAASIIVNNFGPQIKGKTLDFIEKNIAELERAKRCSQISSGSIGRASVVAAAYLMIHTGTIPFYEAELFFKVFQTDRTNGTDGYEPSSAKIARQMFTERRAETGQRSQKEQLDILCQALLDFHNGHARMGSYKVAEPFSFEPYMKKVWAKDGIR